MSSPPPPTSVMLPALAVSESFPSVPTTVEPDTELENQWVDLPLPTSVSAGTEVVVVVTGCVEGAGSWANTTLDGAIEVLVTPLRVSVSPPPNDTTVSAPTCVIAAANEAKSANP